MNIIIRALAALGLFFAAAGAASAQTIVVADCSAATTIYAAGQAGRAIIIDVAGKQCVNTGSSGGGGASTIADGADVTQGATTDAACATDNGTCTVEAVLKRIAQRITTAIAGTAVALNATPSIANGNGIIVAPSASATAGIIPVVCGSASSSCVLKAAAGNLYSVYAECSAACWLQVFNSTTAPSNGATTAGIASGNMVECIPIQAGGAGGLSSAGMPPSVYTVGITATISSTTCATLTLATTGFVKGLIQ